MAGSPNARTAITALGSFDLRFGVYNPRHISSNPLRPWSQHAGAEPAQRYYGNAIDIVHNDYGYTNKPEHQAELDEVYVYLDSRRSLLSIRQILWRVRSHYDHIHCDFYPAMADEFWRKHPTKGGPVVVRRRDGSLGSTYGTAPPPPPPKEDEMTLKPGDSGNAVSYYQKAINAWGRTTIAVDGEYGALTEQAVEQYQKAADLETTGVIDGVTAFLLGRYNLTGTAGDYAIKKHNHETTGRTTT